MFLIMQGKQCKDVTKHITETYLYNFDPLKPYLYIVKLGFTGVDFIFFLFLLKNIYCGYSLEPPRQGGSNEYQQSLFLSRNMKKKIRIFSYENFQFLVVKLSIFLKRHAFRNEIYYLKANSNTDILQAQ